MWRHSIPLVIAATLAVPLMDSAVANGAGRKVAAALQDAPDTPQGPRVTIHRFPVLAQVAFHHPVPGQNPPAGLQLTSATKKQRA